MNRVVKHLKEAVQNYNTTPCVDDGYPRALTYNEVVNEDCSIQAKVSDNHSIPASVQQNCKQLVDVMLRCTEEIKLLENDMISVVSKKLHVLRNINDLIKTCTDDQSGLAMKAKLVALGMDIELTLEHLKIGSDPASELGLPDPLPTKFKKLVEDSSLATFTTTNIGRVAMDISDDTCDYCTSSDEESDTADIE